MSHFKAQKPTHYIILSGDQLYRMDLRDFFDSHVRSGASISVATTAVNRTDASRFGIVKTDDTNRIIEFKEKPAPGTDISEWKISPELMASIPDPDKEYLASMGIYIFNASTLEAVLAENDSKDFGKEVIPNSIGNYIVNAYVFNGYWEDIGTIKSFYDANIKLTDIDPEFNFYNEVEPIYTHMRNLPPSKINGATIFCTLTSEGCVITNCKLSRSIIGVRSIIENGTELSGVIMMGADFYQNPEEKKEDIKKGLPTIGIGKNCFISRTIIDKNARIGNNVRINADGRNYENGDHGNFYSADGIIVIRKGAVIPDGTII